MILIIIFITVANAWQRRKDFAKGQQNTTPVILTIDHNIPKEEKEDSWELSVILKKDVKINHVITTSVERSKALDDEGRAAMINMLSHKPMSAEELTKELKKAGLGKATTTVRHHLDVLKDCGLIEIVRIQEVRGAVLKHYASTIKFLGFENSFDSSKYTRAINETSSKLLKIADSIVEKYGAAIRSADGHSCPYCNIQHGKEYVIIEILNRALAEIVQKKEFIDLIKGLNGKEKSKT